MLELRTTLKMKLNFKVLKYINLIVVFLFLLITSCQNKNRHTTLDFFNITNANSILLFIDVESCSSCIDKISILFNEYSDSKMFDFVFIENQSLKKFKLISGNNFKDEINIHYISNENYLKLNGGYGSYIAINSDGFILNSKKINPSNFDDLIDLFITFYLENNN